MSMLEPKNFVARRSHDFPDVTKFPASLLREAADYYEKVARHMDKAHGNGLLNDFSIKFNMSTNDAQILLSAARFRHEMKKKGLA